ncbi:YtxH domain-containing protein [Desemzia sp. RIT804]|uniref:YtxH domain-containing protein n=1 Tax=Desemzia sp. RIT 804 TaxID=2810209 RepID=UPI0019506B2C|nr:YtxH domain-containing protein [Desemzia sp. RIT 804]MBM6613416.1 YtxH domain-containing protein [Desemzia sp. RIT 804]
MKIGLASGIVFGAIVGGAYGLLKTPRTGEQNREAMKSYLDDTTVLVQDVTDKVKDLKGAISELTNEGKTLATDFAKDMNETVQEFSYEVEPRMRRIQDQANKLNSDVQDMTESMKTPTEN